MTVEQMSTPAPELPADLNPAVIEAQNVAAAHQETIDAQAAYDEQLQANAELTRKREAEHYAKAYMDAHDRLHAEPEHMPFGDDEVRAASGWKAKVHVVAHRAGEEAVVERRRGIQQEQERVDRERAFAESREGDDWDGSVSILDTVRERAEAADQADPSNPNNWREFDSLFEQLRSGEQRAYTHHVDQQAAAANNSSTESKTGDAEAKTDDGQGEDDAEKANSGDETKEPTDEDDDDDKNPPTPPRRVLFDDDDRPTVPLPPIRADGPRDPRYKLAGFQTWTQTQLDVANAQARGEHVPERDRLLEKDYFHQIEDLDNEGLEFINLIAQANQDIAAGRHSSQETRDRIDELAAALNGRNPGQVDKLIAVYAARGEFQNPEGDVNTTHLTPEDAEFIHLLHQYKGNDRSDRVRRQIRELYERIHGAEGEVPVNWLRMTDGTIEPIYGARTRNKADWLIDRHAGARHHAVFELIAGGGMEAPVGNPERLGQRIGNMAMRGLGITAIRRKIAARRTRP